MTSNTPDRKKVSFWGRNYLINTKLQLLITGYTLLFGLSMSLFVGFLTVYLQSAAMYDTSSIYSLSIVVGFFVMTILLQIIMGWYLTNKIAGPLYSLKKHMTAVLANENPEPLKFRKDDFFIDVAEDYNKVIDLLNHERSSKTN